jgi:excinuclease ABC subunit C
MTASALDGVPGLGPVRRQRLLKELGGVRAVRAAGYPELAALPWLPQAVARALYERLHGTAPPPVPAGGESAVVAPALAGADAGATAPGGGD